MAMPEPDQWPAFYTEYATFLEELEELGEPRGIRPNRDKAFLLLPPTAPAPGPGVLPAWVKVVRDGVVVAGAAIGTDDFVRQHFAQALDDYREGLSQLEPLAHAQPTCGMVLLGRCFTKMLSYLVRVTPTHLVADLIADADAATARARHASLTPEGVTAPACSDARLQRADEVAALPLRSGGFGHTPLALTAPAAFYSSVAGAHQCDAFASVSHALADSLVDAHSRLLTAIGGPSAIKPGSRLADILPLDTARLSEKEFFLDIFSNDPKLKIESTLSRAIGKHSRKSLLAKVHPDQAGPNDLTMADSVHLSLLSNRSQLSRFLSASLWVKANRTSPVHARATMRYILDLPQLLRLGNHRLSSSTDCEVDVCQAHRDGAPELDPTGDHICSRCPCGGLPQAALHRRILTVTHSFASQCATSRVEPPTSAVLLNDYTDDDCRLLFPKNPNAETNRVAARAIQVHEELATCPPDAPGRAALVEEWASLQAMLDGKTSSRRLDLEITAHDGDVAWVDVAGLHPTAASYLGPNTSFVRKLAEDEGRDAPTMMGQSSPAVRTRARQKSDKYQPFCAVADQQLKGGKRVTRPSFFPCIVSHSGELSSDFFRLIGWLTGKLKKTAAGAPRRDGLTPAVLGSRFAADFKAALMCAVVNGFGQMLTSGGFVGYRRILP